MVHEAIVAHGGERFESSEVSFDFRGTAFRVERDGGRFLYERSYRDDGGRRFREWMTNDGTFMEVDGSEVVVSPEERTRIETAVNSVVYFGFLPFRLDDAAVQLQDLGTVTVAGEPYRKIEVTFAEEGGGDDWEDRFIYWFHGEAHTLDFLAYRYFRDGGGTRFRRAVNRREIGGILFQDYENMTGAVPVLDIAEFDRMWEEERVIPISMVELENVRVAP